MVYTGLKKQSSKALLLLVTLVFVVILVLQIVLFGTARAAVGDFQTAGIGVAGDMLSWNSIASSGDGTKLVASTNIYGMSGSIYTSSNSGESWTK